MQRQASPLEVLIAVSSWKMGPWYIAQTHQMSGSNCS